MRIGIVGGGIAGPVAALLLARGGHRRAHIRWYTWLSRFMTPVFQSDLVPLGWARDAFFGPVGRIPWVRRQFVDILLGCQTSPWTAGQPDGVSPTRRDGRARRLTRTGLGRTHTE